MFVKQPTRKDFTKEGDALEVQQKLFESVVSKCTELEAALEASRAEVDGLRETETHASEMESELRELRSELERSNATSAAAAAEIEALRHELAEAKSEESGAVTAGRALATALSSALLQFARRPALQPLEAIIASAPSDVADASRPASQLKQEIPTRNQIH